MRNHFLAIVLFVFAVNNVCAEPTAASVLAKRFELRETLIPVREMPGWSVPKKIAVFGNSDRLSVLRKTFPDIEFSNLTNLENMTGMLDGVDVFIGYCIDEVINSQHQLRWLMSLSVGVENCAASDNLKVYKTLVTNVKKLSGPEIAEHAIAFMMALNRGLDAYGVAQQQSRWKRSLLPGEETIWEIEGRTLLVVGLGGIGKEVARRANGLGMKVIATRNSSREGPEYVSYVGLADEALTLAKQADVVINSAPLTEKTRGMFNKEFFSAMPSHAYFISVGRGQSTNTDDLLAALKSGDIAGAGLDVTDPEPLPDNHPLWLQPRVIITPHVAARSEKYFERVWLLVEENLQRYVKGEKLLSPVNLGRGY